MNRILLLLTCCATLLGVSTPSQAYVRCHGHGYDRECVRYVPVYRPVVYERPYYGHRYYGHGYNGHRHHWRHHHRWQHRHHHHHRHHGYYGGPAIIIRP